MKGEVPWRGSLRPSVMAFWSGLLLWPSGWKTFCYGHLIERGSLPEKTPPCVGKVGGTHPTGMPSCFKSFCEPKNISVLFFRSLADPKDTWIGLYKPTRHVADTRWIDNTPFVFNDINYYQPWFPGDPNERNAACVRIEAASARWRDKPCGRNFWAVCERGKMDHYFVYDFSSNNINSDASIYYS